jgi:hypothetical protein
VTWRLVKAALAAYPLAFRRRYGEEMLALVEDSPSSVWAVLDLLRGALVAHARPVEGLSAAVGVGDRLRASASGVLACWIAFAAAGFGFYKTTEDHPYSEAGSSHPVLGGAHLAVQLLAIIASIAIVAGALPLVMAALRQMRLARAARRPTGLAVGSVALFAIATMALVLLGHPAHALPAADRVVFSIWILVGLASGAVCAFAASRGLFAIGVRRWALVAALACGTLVTAAMALMTLATALYVVSLAVDASGLAGRRQRPLRGAERRGLDRDPAGDHARRRGSGLAEHVPRLAGSEVECGSH